MIGVTGSFGSGKSSVVNFFRELGAIVLDADQLAHEALNESSPVFATIKEAFGEAWDEEKKVLDRKKLANIIFSDHERRKLLEEVVHPYVFQRIREASEGIEGQLVVEVPLLFESGFDKECEKVVNVFADEDVIQMRLREKGFTEEEIIKRTRLQLSADEKNKKADFVVNNSHSLDQTQSAVKELWEVLKRT